MQLASCCRLYLALPLRVSRCGAIFWTQWIRVLRLGGIRGLAVQLENRESAYATIPLFALDSAMLWFAISKKHVMHQVASKMQCSYSTMLIMVAHRPKLGLTETT